MIYLNLNLIAWNFHKNEYIVKNVFNNVVIKEHNSTK